jgi:uncharacterized protein
MAAEYHSIDLGQLGLTPGDGRRLEVEVLPGSLTIAGQSYEPAARTAPARLDVSRTAAGYAFRLRFSVDLAGPCVRCLDDAAVRIEVDAREVDQPGSDDEQLESPYVEGDELDLSWWAHDALALAMPLRFLCRDDCAGLCPVCGQSLNDADPAHHQHAAPEGDPRWAKLRELKLD